MRTSEADILIIPGLGNSGPDHWQSRWEAKLPTARRVEQRSWSHPVLDDWLANLVGAIDAATKPVIVVGHSLGARAIAHLPEDKATRVAGAFLVTPPSSQFLLQIAEIDPAFAAPVSRRLLFPGLLIASRDDPYSTYEESEALAKQLGIEVVDAGLSGHLNIESGHGPWPEGLMRFAGFLKSL